MIEWIQIPPIRTALEDPDATTESRTAKEWYYYWQQLGDQLSGLVAYGKHSARPKAASVPDGALYFEQDRGSALYELQAGAWDYISGVMWGTLSPDQRPTDLKSPHDIGFEFWATDQAPVRKFIWSGSAWLDYTPTNYGTHAARLALTAANIAPGVLYIETDRGNVVYEMRQPSGSNAWVYSTGTMTGTLSPDQRPGDLGTNDTGFFFLTTDTKQTFRWSGAAWVDLTIPVTAANTYQYVQGTGNQTLTTSATAISGLSLTITQAGVYRILAIVDVAANGVNDSGSILFSQIAIDGTGSSPTLGLYQVSTAGAVSNRATVPVEWRYVLTSGTHTVTVIAWKNTGTGSSLAFGSNSMLSALWVSP